MLGADGQTHKGGLWVFDKQQAGIFMGVIDGELPLGLRRGEIVDHWNTTNEWWVKFGQAEAMHDWNTGVLLTPLEATLKTAGLLTDDE